MNTVQILKDARDLIANKGWSQGTWGRDEFGNSTQGVNDRTCSFCTMGAIYAAGKFDLHSTKIDRFVRALGFEGEGSVISWNDNPRTTWEKVLDRFDVAIKSEEMKC